MKRSPRSRSTRPAWLMESLEKRTLLDAAIDIELIPLLAPSGGDTSATLPTALTSASAGQTFYVEVWAKNVDGSANGIVGGYLDFTFDPTKVTGGTLSHGNTYTSLTMGSVNNATGLVDDLGGAVIGNNTLGDNEWVRLGYVPFTVAAGATGSVSFTAAAGGDTFARAGEGGIAWSNVELNVPVRTVTLPAPQLPTLSINDVTVTEGSSGTTNAVFTVTLSSASTQTVTVQYATANGTATAGSDYTATSGLLTFSPGGSLTQTVTVAVLGDTVFESNETFNVNLTNPTNATMADAQGVGTINNDDWFEVRIGDGYAKSLTYEEPDGTRATVSMSRGYVTLQFGGSNLSSDWVSRTKQAVYGNNVLLAGVVLNGTTSSAKLSVSAKGGDGLVAIGGLSGIGSLGTLSAAKAVLDANGAENTVVGSLGTVKLHDLRDVDLRVTGMDASGWSLKTLTVSGQIADAQIRTAWGMKTLTAGQIIHSVVFAGVRDTVSGLPTSSADLDGYIAIAKVSVKGVRYRDSFVNSNIAAWALGSLTLKNVSLDNNDVPFGLACMEYGSCRYNLTGGPTVTLRGQAHTDYDFAVCVL